MRNAPITTPVRNKIPVHAMPYVLSAMGMGIELIVSAAIVIWGFTLLMPGDTFTPDGAYSPLKDIAPEEVWGIIAIILGAIGLISLVMFFGNGYYWGIMRLFKLTLCSWFWIILADLIIRYNPNATIGYIFILFALGSWATAITSVVHFSEVVPNDERP